jgi:pilus assembly protein CpaB
VVKAVTVEVATKDAQKLTLAAGTGQLSLALRQAASNEGETTERVTMADLTGDTPSDVAQRQGDADRSEEQFKSIRTVLENLGDHVDQRVSNVEAKLDKLNAPQAPKPEPDVREVIKYVQPEPPAMASVGVTRGMARQVYEVPRTK